MLTHMRAVSVALLLAFAGSVGAQNSAPRQSNGGLATERRELIDALGAAELPEADVRTLAIAGSKLDFVNLRSAQIRDVEFVECRIGELDLGQAQLERVAFRDCVVEHLRLDGARSRSLDLRGAALGVLSGLDSARGVLISGLQATELAEQFAAHLGFTLAD